MEDPALAGAGNSWFAMRLRLEAVGPVNAPDLWRAHNDDEVPYWYGNEKPSLEQAEQWAKFLGDSWLFHGVGQPGELLGYLRAAAALPDRAAAARSRRQRGHHSGPRRRPLRAGQCRPAHRRAAASG